MTIHSLYSVFFTHFRAQRIARLYAAHNITAQTRVLDVGGTPAFWNLANSLGYPLPALTLLNRSPAPATLPHRASWVRADAREMPFPGKYFDLAFSNSVIEHLATHDAQARMAAEVSRVARAYWVQTPDIRFPIEPHYIAPFIHWVPVKYRGSFARFTLWAALQKPSRAEIEERIAEIRLLGPLELKAMFPSGRIISEYFLGIPKSLVACSLATKD